MSIHVRLQSTSPEDIRRWLREDVHLDDLPSFHELSLGCDWDALHIF